MKTAVIVGRFQAHTLHRGYREMLTHAFTMDKYQQVIIVVCNAYRIPSKTDPLTFLQRKYILEKHIEKVYGHIPMNYSILPLNDNEFDKVWSKNLDTLVSATGSKLSKCTFIHSRDSFKSYYHGKINDYQEITPVAGVSSTNVRKEASVEKAEFFSKDFNRGVVYASQQGYPQVVPTVDIAVIYVDRHEGPLLILGKKPNKDTYCLPGGFVDNSDEGLIQAAQRELQEETGIVIPDSKFKYVDSQLIKDWRFKGLDVIMTSLFVAVIKHDDMAAPFMMKDFKANDDLEAVTKIPLIVFSDDAGLDIISKNHKPLVSKIYEYAKSNKLI